jgi:hypothetical protein
MALLTDFGLSDAYVGTMKGVILGICPDAHLIDLTHTIEPQNVRQAAYVLFTAYRYFPPHTVFLIVVDPGVGTARRPIAVETDHGVYITPDNGALSFVLPHVQIRHTIVLQNPDYQLATVSQTFHGRDIFGPAAAHLASGVPITNLGPNTSRLYTFPEPRLEITSTQIRGEVLHIDHFGNIITSIGRLIWTGPHTLHLQPQFGHAHPGLPPVVDAVRCTITVGAQTVQTIHKTYSEVPPGTLAALVGSSDQLEIGVNQGNAAQHLSASIGDPVIVECA